MCVCERVGNNVANGNIVCGHNTNMKREMQLFAETKIGRVHFEATVYYLVVSPKNVIRA